MPPANSGSSSFPTCRIAKLTGHNGPVHALTYSSADSVYILTGSTDRLVRLYNPAKAPLSATSDVPANPSARPAGLVQTYTGHAHEVLDIAVSSDNARFVSVGGDKHVLLWDVAQAKVLRRWEGHSGRVNACAWGGDGREDGIVASGGFDTSVKLWDAKSNAHKPLMNLADAKDSISCIEIVDAEVFTGSVDGRVRVYDMRMGRVSVDVIGHSVTSVSPTRRNDAYLVSTLDSTLRLMDKSSGKLLQAYRSPNFSNTNYRLRSTLCSHDSIILSGSEDGRIIAWDLLEGHVRHELWHDENMKGSMATKRSVVSAVSECTSRKEWCSAGGDGNVIVWGMDDR